MPPRKNHTFSHKQYIWIVTNYMENLKVQTLLDCNSASTSNCHPRHLPHSSAFSRVINRLMASVDVSPSKFPGSPEPKLLEKHIGAVRNLVH